MPEHQDHRSPEHHHHHRKPEESKASKTFNRDAVIFSVIALILVFALFIYLRTKPLTHPADTAQTREPIATPMNEPERNVPPQPTGTTSTRAP